MSAGGTPRPDAASLRVFEGVLLLALGLAARLPLVIAYPAIHGDDSVVRLARSDELLVGYWLPLPQLAGPAGERAILAEPAPGRTNPHPGRKHQGRAGQCQEPVTHAGEYKARAEGSRRGCRARVGRWGK